MIAGSVYALKIVLFFMLQINKFHGFPHDVTCLMAAVQKGLVPFVQLLLEAGAEVNDINPVRKVYSIHLAVRTNRPEILDLLLRFRADVNVREGQGRTALHVLISSWGSSKEDGAEEIRWKFFDLLLSHPAVDVNAEDNDGTTPLELAVLKNLKSLVNKLLQAGAVVNQHVRQAMEV